MIKRVLKRVYHWCGQPAWMKRSYERLLRRSLDQANYAPQSWSDMIASWCGGLTGKRILEVGCDLSGQFVTQLFRLYQPVEMVGLNPQASNVDIAPGCRIETGDIRETSYPDGYFDVIVSSSAFEHIQTFEVAVEEMYRILRPGGYLFSHFGPIWSGTYGHHVTLTYQGTLYNYWNLILPPYCHLLMTPEQVADSLARTHPPDFCRLVAEYVFTSEDQNRLFYEDYEAIITKSAFKVLLFKGYDHWELSERYNVSVTPETFRLLQRKYPGRRHFAYDGITLLLAKPK